MSVRIEHGRDLGRDLSGAPLEKAHQRNKDCGTGRNGHWTNCIQDASLQRTLYSDLDSVWNGIGKAKISKARNWGTLRIKRAIYLRDKSENDAAALRKRLQVSHLV